MLRLFEFFPTHKPVDEILENFEIILFPLIEAKKPNRGRL